MKLQQIDRAFRQLRRALATLDDTDGRMIARRNARKRTLAALRQIRVAVDTLYPAIVSRKGTGRLTVKGRVVRLERAGWAEVDEMVIAGYAAAGITVKRVAEVITRNAGTPLEVTEVRERFFLPEWALAIGSATPARLRAAKASPALRRAALAEAMLRGTKAAG
jgi:hypothetical protein